MNPMAPDLFAREMREIANRAEGDIAGRRHPDEPGAHIAADDLMCRLLKALGYGEGVAIFEKMPKWYE